jgi:hypothetical protein
MTWATLPTDRILTVNANLEACDHASFLVVFSLSWRSHSHICPLDSTRTLVHPMVMDGFKCEHEPHNILEDPSLPQKYRAFRHNCTRPWTWKRDGSPHEMCTLHRHQAQYNVQRRKRLLRVLVDALKLENGDPTVESSGNIPRRPRLVLLGNQQALILGVVDMEQGDLGDFSRQLL